MVAILFQPQCVNGDGISYHYSDVIMGVIISQITSLTIVYSTIYSDAGSKKTSKHHWPLCGKFTSDWFDLTKDTPALSLWACLGMMGVLSSIVFWRKSTMVNDKELIIPFAQRSWTGVYWFHLVCLSETAINGSVVLGADESLWPCGTPSWYTPLSWTILSEQNNLHLFLSQHICVFSKMSVPLSVPLSVCGQNLVRSVSSTIPGRSISYLYILSTNFRRCVACWVLWKILKFEFFAISSNLHLWLCLVSM